LFTKASVWVRVILLSILLGGGMGILSKPALAQDSRFREDGSQRRAVEGTRSGSSGNSSASGPALTGADFERYGTAGRLGVGTLYTVPLNILVSPLCLFMDMLEPGRGFPRMKSTFKVFGAYGEAWGTLLGPAATGVWIGGKFVVFDAPVAAGGWAGPRLWTGASHVFYVWPVAAGAWVGSGFRSRNNTLESAYASLEKGDNLEASRLFREELRRDRADAAARSGLAKATNARLHMAEAENPQVPGTSPPAFLSSSGAGAGFVGAGASGRPGAAGSAAAAAGTEAFTHVPRQVPSGGYRALQVGSDTSPGRQLKSAVFTSSAAANSTTIEEAKDKARMTFEGGGVYKGDLNPIVKVGRAGPPVEYRVPDKMSSEPSVAKLNEFKAKERAAVAAAAAAQARYEEAKRSNPDPKQLEVLLVEARIAQDKGQNLGNMVLVQVEAVKKVAFEKFAIGAEDAPAPTEPPTKEGGK